MKILCCAVVLALFACTAESESPNTIVGEWEIEWRIDEMLTVGTININENGFAEIITSSPNELLSPGVHKADYTWGISDSELRLTRVDNEFELTYKIVSSEDQKFRLILADEIHTTLIRIH